MSLCPWAHKALEMIKKTLSWRALFDLSRGPPFWLISFREFPLSNCKTFVPSGACGKALQPDSLQGSVQKDERSNMRGIFLPNSTQPKKWASRKLFSGEVHWELDSRNTKLFLWSLPYQNTEGSSYLPIRPPERDLSFLELSEGQVGFSKWASGW